MNTDSAPPTLKVRQQTWLWIRMYVATVHIHNRHLLLLLLFYRPIRKQCPK